MADNVGIRLVGLSNLKASMDRISPNVQDRLRLFMSRFVIDLKEQVKANIADRFKSTGPLYQSVQAEMIEEIGSITGRVFLSGVAYAAIQEYGGRTSPHDIRPINGKALAFMAPMQMVEGMSPGKMRFSSGDMESGMVLTQVVHHPGSVMPERTYARLALVQMRSPFEGGIREAVSLGIMDSLDLRGSL